MKHKRPEKVYKQKETISNMLGLLAKAALTGLIAALIVAFVLWLIPGGGNFGWVAPVVGILVGAQVYFSGNKQL